MDFKQIDLVVAINTYGSITKAAKGLYLSQPYLSKVLREVEAEVGTALFERDAAGVRPTPAGVAFLVRARKLLQGLDELGQISKEQEREVRRLTFSTCTYYSHGADVCVRLLERFGSEDRVDFSIRESSNSDVVADVAAGISQLGLVIIGEGQREDFERLLVRKGLTAQRVCSLTPELVVRQGHPLLSQPVITKGDIARCGVVIHDTSLPAAELDEFPLFRYFEGIAVRRRITVNSRAALHNLLRRTDCVGMGVKSTLDQPLHLGIVSVPLSEAQEPACAFYLISMRGYPLGPLARRLWDTMLECYGDEDAPGEGAGKPGRGRSAL